jgi:hypothetical protein
VLLRGRGDRKEGGGEERRERREMGAKVSFATSKILRQEADIRKNFAYPLRLFAAIAKSQWGWASWVMSPDFSH